MDSGSKKEQPRLAKVEKGDGYQGKSAGPYGYCGRSDSRQRDFESSGLEHRPVLESRDSEESMEGATNR